MRPCVSLVPTAIANNGESASSGRATARSFLDFVVLALVPDERTGVFFGFGFVLPFRDLPAAAARGGRAVSFFRAGRAEDVRFVCFAKTWCSRRSAAFRPKLPPASLPSQQLVVEHAGRRNGGKLNELRLEVNNLFLQLRHFARGQLRQSHSALRDL